MIERLRACPEFCELLSPTLPLLHRFLARHPSTFVWSSSPDMPTRVGLSENGRYPHHSRHSDFVNSATNGNSGAAKKSLPRASSGLSPVSPAMQMTGPIQSAFSEQRPVPLMPARSFEAESLAQPSTQPGSTQPWNSPSAYSGSGEVWGTPCSSNLISPSGPPLMADASPLPVAESLSTLAPSSTDAGSFPPPPPPVQPQSLAHVQQAMPTTARYRHDPYSEDGWCAAETTVTHFPPQLNQRPATDIAAAQFLLHAR